MSRSSLADDYPRAIKVVSIRNQQTCNNRYFLGAVPPEDMLQTKELYVEIVFQFEGDVDPSLQKFTKVGVASDYPGIQEGAPAIAKYLESEFAADASGLIHLSLDLTALIVNPTGYNYVEIQLPDDFFGAQSFGVFKLWKIDLVHTTEGVRSRQA